MRRLFTVTLLACAFIAVTTAESASARPRILSRAEWGADETLLTTAAEESTVTETVISTDEQAVPERVKACTEAQRLYPHEFKTVRTVTKDADGNRFLWPQSYSSEVKMIVVHHTALTVSGDVRTPLERIRALYQYHAGSLGWGDIGYRYLIDEEGTIYEGRAGGDKVVGGHAYCANVGTVGIALLGNFEKEKPTLAQIQSLQWLLSDLAGRYKLDLGRDTMFHGKATPVVIGHQDVVSTACPGYFLEGVLSQIRKNVLNGTLSAGVVFPPPLEKNYADQTDIRRSARLQRLSLQPQAPTFTPIGDTRLTVRPGGQVTASLLFRAGADAVQRRSRIASVVRSSPRIGIWQQIESENLRVRTDILLPRLLHKGEVETIRLRFQAPTDPGTYTVDIGSVTYFLQAEGRRNRTAIGEPVSMSFSESNRTNTPTPGSVRSSSSTSSTSTTSRTSSTSQTSNPIIRIRLSTRESGALSCSAYDLAALQRNYRGEVTCTIVNGVAALINDVSMEDYLAGLAEEPDTEPYEKQRAFAIAARSYAVYYLDAEHRKFPGMSYDGDDSPARFQAYAGISAESGNPQWVRAVKSTAGQVLTKNGAIIKAAYFSSDDGRTRTPAENGWKNFPFEEVFASKPDPWCKGLPMAGHGVGMSGCGAEGQAEEGKSAEEILEYYYEGTEIEQLAQ
ncbi:MAG: N-acetylmuramoyl-L-alanine amidase [Candidatus Peribacteraceae bacterium]|nr:N-acetylmuramoyl-L-alanine amidase [Candidatus Peribacteraceae bacterium]